MKRTQTLNSSMAAELEKTFANNNYHGTTEAGLPFHTETGSIPILVSAPHATKHKRNDSIKEQDNYTGAIALLLHQFTDCHLIYATKLGKEDPNYTKGGGLYKKKVVDMINSFNIKYLIDLHGASEKRPFSIDMGTCYGKTMKDDTLCIIKNALVSSSMQGVKQNHHFPAANPNTVTHYANARTGVESVQLEINKVYRDPIRKEDLFLRCVNGLRQMIVNLST
ncbi:hypothetical protein [Alteribacillus bidgolensis]|uniref:N-formylglutamate amidohydrolase n=1 Tax=Alteribacillus bidgolensis TaxID=930129 RepID=A0A1G8K7H5_9BACI|nr:hypothetical protein [Alteribacillus bidgolensis]SDI39371.1 hypothetical protein SAMN05216352_10797 [Alteribacillus bidgolensis]